MISRQLVVVGAGPAGMAAAREAVRCGLCPTLIDEAHTLGGNYFRGRKDAESNGSPRDFQRSAQGIELLLGTSIIDAPEKNILVIAGEGESARVVQYDALVIATGAYDRSVPLPGWTLPGVFTAGGASILAKAFGVTPGKRVLVAGSGPFLLSVADDLSAHGCQVIIAEATPLATSVSGLPLMLSDFEMARQTAGYLARLTRRRVRRHYRQVVTMIHGDTRVQGATLMRVNNAWNPIPGTEQQLVVDAVCLGFGFVPQLELAQMLGCAILHDSATSDFFVKCDSEMRTTISNVYAAGEVTGIAGMREAMLEGKFAANTAALDLGAITPQEHQAQQNALRVPLERARRFAWWIRHAFRPRVGLWSLAQPETIVCRCEDVRLRDACAALETNPPTPYAIKTATRAGMGLCQGRVCAPYWIEWLRAHHNYALPEMTVPWRIRPPLKPVRLGEWLGSVQ